MSSTPGGWSPGAPGASVSPEAAALLARVAPTSGLGNFVVILIGVAVLIAIASAIGDVAVYARAETLVNEPLSEEAWVVLGATAGVQFLVHIVALVLLLVWLHRSWRNAETLGVLDLPFSAGWAVGGWFVPLLNFVRPYQSMRDVERASRQLASGARPEGWSSLRADRKVNLWWIFFLVSAVMSSAANNTDLSNTGDVLSFIRQFALIDLVANVLHAAAGVMLLLVVRQATRAQAEAVQLRGGGFLGL